MERACSIVCERGGERHEGGMDASSAFLLHFANMNRKPTLDVDIVSHCNLNCVSCCHFSPLAEPHFLSLDEYGRELRMLAEIEGVGSFLLPSPEGEERRRGQHTQVFTDRANSQCVQARLVLPFPV